MPTFVETLIDVYRQHRCWGSEREADVFLKPFFLKIHFIFKGESVELEQRSLILIF